MELYTNTITSCLQHRVFFNHPVTGVKSDTWVDVLSPESEARQRLFQDAMRGYQQEIKDGVVPQPSFKVEYDYDTDRIVASVVGWNFKAQKLDGVIVPIEFDAGMVRSFFTDKEHAWRRRQLLREMDKAENFIIDSTPTYCAPQG